jgi:hypothetical protein
VVDRGEPEASCSEWHGDGTAGEHAVASHLAAVAPARVMGKAVQGDTASLASRQRRRGRYAQMSPLQRSGCGGLSAAEPDSSPARPGPPAMGVAVV